MNELVLFLVAGALLLIVFLLWLFMGPPKIAEKKLPTGAMDEMVSLPGLAFAHSDVLLDDRDCRLLRASPGLELLAYQLRRDRKKIILLWLRVLARDVRTLWQFHRLLVRSGASTSLGEEWRIARIAAMTLVFLLVLRGVVSVVGPFALPVLVRRSREQIEVVYGFCADLLSRIPRSNWAEIERKWAAEHGAPLVS